MIGNGKHGLATDAGGSGALIAKIVLTLLGLSVLVLFLLYWTGAVHGGAGNETDLVPGSVVRVAVP